MKVQDMENLVNNRMVVICRRFIAICLGAIICSCNAANNQASSTNNLNQKIQTVLKSSSQSLPYTMGGTYDTTTGYPTTASSLRTYSNWQSANGMSYQIGLNQGDLLNNGVVQFTRLDGYNLNTFTMQVSGNQLQ